MILRTVMLTLFLSMACSAPAQSQGQPQTSEREAFSKAAQVGDPAERIKALEQFLKDFPSGSMNSLAYSRLAEACARTSANTPENAKKAVEYAERSIEAVSEANKAAAFNSAAMILSGAKIANDKALEYGRKALDLARAQNASPRLLASYLSTLAGVELAQGNYADAATHQREAIALLPKAADSFTTNLSHFTQLAAILIKSGKGEAEGADLLARAIILGQYPDPERLLDRALKALGAADIEAKKIEIFRQAGQNYIESASASERAAATSRVAMGYSRRGILAADALLLAQTAVSGLTPSSSAQTVLDCHRTLGIVYAQQKSYKDAVAQFGPVARIATPFDTDFHLNYGQSLEALGRNEDAINAYLGGVVALPSSMQSGSRLWQPLNDLYRKVNGSDAGLKEKIARLGEGIANFRPSGPPQKAKAGRVVLAELFTGSECPPCVASDLAFDHLLAGYERGALAVLEYHLHIPGPDPMTNADTEARGKYYQVRGTPTAAIGGTSIMVGGGPKTGAKSRYDLYSFDVDRRLALTTPVEIQLSGETKENSVSVRASAAAKGAAGDLRLRVVLVEEAVRYKGSNGIEEHRAVVRQMIGAPEGIPLANGQAEHAATVDLAELSAGLRAYLENYEKNGPRKDFKWKEMKHAIDPANLSLVAFVQDDGTREVLQAAYFRLGSGGKTD